MAFEGRCLCGAVTFGSIGSPVFMGNCYCSDCRRESGTGHITAVAVPESTLTVEGETREFVKPADSGETITNVFCPVCRDDAVHAALRAAGSGVVARRHARRSGAGRAAGEHVCRCRDPVGSAGAGITGLSRHGLWRMMVFPAARLTRRTDRR